ncbi:MAG: TatD family nuclease-associated radical SAM protein [Oscillospiraceae bacterium]|jgi:TatD family-associated radical SAM protein|nr:TatD family nuclease-associated radical SAM protein [Oscillospiraceae bacterium]
MTITYHVGDGLYVNLTNRCSNHCDFCERDKMDGVGDASSLWLPREPSAAEIWDSVSAHDPAAQSELVFCGFGEPTERLDILLETAAHVRRVFPQVPIRLNTNGMGNLIAGTDVTPRLAGLIDVVSISLNYARASDYEAHCLPDYPDAFAGMLDFTRRAVGQVPRVVMSVVRGTLPEEDIDVCRALAESLGASLRVRAYH